MGWSKSVIEQDLIDEETTNGTRQAFAALKRRWRRHSEQVAAQTGISVDLIHEVAAIFAEAPRSIALCAEGIVRRPNGYHNVLNLIDLAWVTGKLGQAGCGVNTVTEEINEQGAVDMGVAPEFLPGQARFDAPPSDNGGSRPGMSPCRRQRVGRICWRFWTMPEWADQSALRRRRKSLATLPASLE